MSDKKAGSGYLTKIAAGFALLIAFKMCSSAIGSDKKVAAAASAQPTPSAAPLSSPPVKQSREQKLAEARGEIPEMISGCCLRCLSYARTVANDPDSIDCVKSTTPEAEGDKWVTTMLFRGKNGFGATVVNKKKFFLQNDRVIDMQ